MTTPRPMTTPNLAGLLTQRPPTTPVGSTTPRPVSTDTPPTAQDAGSVELTTRVAPDAGTSEPARTSDETSPVQYLRSITVYLPRELHRQAGVTAAGRGTTRTALILEAVNHTYQQLGDALAADDDAPRTPGEGQVLFAVPQARPASPPSVQTTIRITDDQYTALAELVERHATNRSRIIASALRLHLATIGS